MNSKMLEAADTLIAKAVNDYNASAATQYALAAKAIIEAAVQLHYAEFQTPAVPLTTEDEPAC